MLAPVSPMPRQTIENITPRLDTDCATVLGDTIRYTPDGGSEGVFKAHVDYSDADISLGVEQAIDQDITIEARKVDISAEPASGDRLTIDFLSGRTFKPTNASTDASGTHWVFGLKEVL